ncbi:MAG: LON peptidase substrate-binding domain-containing protein [Gammaproteobacteria bacterium]|nr:LON peptidase substrate-binding domain-containing protein [Gammaproteobacteria bacterium]
MTALPLFPLRTVLFPGGLLPLRIFEPRYLDMVKRCLRDGARFGVVLVRAGGETGPIGAVASLGTSAHILDFDTLPDGLLGVTCRGERRFQLLRRTTAADGLHSGEVEWLPEPPAAALDAVRQPLVQLLQRVLAPVHDVQRLLEPRYQDADWVSWRIAELLPLDVEARQALLETQDVEVRWQRLEPRLGPLLAALARAG